MTREKHFNIALFKSIKSKASKNWRQEVGALLSISQSTLYKKTSGHTSLALAEILILCKHYNISLDNLIGSKNGTAIFQIVSKRKPIKTIHDYLFSLLYELHQVTAQNTIHYATSELPIFHYMHSKKLFAFKLAVWAHTVWNIHKDQSLQNLIFSLLESQEFQVITSDILSSYCKTKSIELWPTTLLDNTINQIKYFSWSGHLYDKRLVDSILGEFNSIISHLELMAETGNKHPFSDPELPQHTDSTNFILYHNEIFHTNNTIILTNCDSDSIHIFITHDSPNFIKSTDLGISKLTYSWFQQMMSMSVKISENAQRHRKGFFSRLKSKVQSLENDIEAIEQLR